MPRSSLTFQDLNEYKQLTGFNLSTVEADVIMRIDAIYNNKTM